MKDARGHGSNPRGGSPMFYPAHQYGIQQVGTGKEKVQQKTFATVTQSPWQTTQRFGNRAVSERVSDRIRSDNRTDVRGSGQKPVKVRTPAGRGDSMHRVRFLGAPSTGPM